MKKVLVIASHFDAENLGCGGTVLRHISQNDKVCVAYVCTGSSQRFGEAILKERKEHASQVLEKAGVQDFYFLDIPLIMADTCPQLEIVTALETVIQSFEPEIVYFHYHEDINSDHRIVADAARVWLRPSKFECIKSVYQYEVFGSTRNFLPDYYVDISPWIEKKLELLALYTTEISAQTRSLETTRIHNQYRGSEVNTRYAEAFKSYYQIVSPETSEK